MKTTPLDQTSEAGYWKMLEHLPAAIYTCDADGRVTNFNEAAAELWGRRPVISKDLWCGSWKIYNTDGSPLPLEECPMAETLRTGKPILGKEIIIERPNGDRLTVQPHPYPLFDESGVLTGAVNMLVDIAPRQQMQILREQSDALLIALDSLKRSEERYHQMIAEVQDYAIILLSTDGIIENWNKGAESIKGYREDEIVGKSFKIFYTPEDQKNGLPDSLIKRASQEGKAAHEGWRVRKDGSKFWGSITITALHDRHQNVIGFSKVTRDLTERKIADEKTAQRNHELQQSEERYHQMIAEVEDYAMIMLDPAGNIQRWNRGAEKIKGYQAEEIIGKHFSVFYTEGDRERNLPQQILAEAIENNKAVHEGWRVRKDGTRFWGSVVLTALHNEQNQVIGFSKVTRDLTERKLAEESLLASSRTLQQKNIALERINEELSSFAYISSHDLQEPLRKIQTFSDRIIELEYDNLTEKGKDLLRRMQGGASRMQTLIKDILAYSRTTTVDKTFEVTDLNELFSQSKMEMEVLILEKKAVIESATLPTMNVIPFQIQQLFNNLLNNALKFSKENIPPRIVITCHIVDADIVNPRNPNGFERYYHMAVSDNGIGFEPQYAQKIFEVFQRLHGRAQYGGTGIGLAICKKIVENHNGVIRAQGQLDDGATFHIYLPLSG